MKRAWGLCVVVFFTAVLLSGAAGGQNAPIQARASDAAARTAPPAPDAPKAESGRLEAVRLQGLCLLAGPQAGAATVRVLRAGEVVRVVSEEGAWAKVEARGGATGYVAAGYLSGARGDAPALYRDKLVEIVRRPGPGDAPGTLVEVAAAPQTTAPAQEAPVQAASLHEAPAAAAPAGCGAMAPDVPAGATGPVAAVSGQALPASGPAADPQGIERLLAFVQADLKRPMAAAARAGEMDPAVREQKERKDRYVIEVYLDQCRLVLFEKKPDGGKVPARTYAVATPAGDVEPPAGWGVITQIEFEPWWRPTESMKRRAKQKGRTLPDVMPPGVKNPMGPFKMHLSHGFAFRIHGNNDPKSIGKRVTNGCIRMRNDEGLELARILDVGTEVVIFEHASSQADAAAGTPATGP